MKATPEDLRNLLKVDAQNKKKSATSSIGTPSALNQTASTPSIEILSPNTRYDEEPTGQPILFPSPAHMLAVLKPEFTCYTWQAEMLVQLAGYLNPKDLGTKSIINPENPFRLCLPAANGSGKDLVVVAAFSVWFSLSGLRIYPSGLLEVMNN